MPKIIPHLWYNERAEEAARFYASVLPDSHVDRVTTLPADSPSGPAGSVDIVEFTLLGQPFTAIGAGPLDEFNHSVSFMVLCDGQAEIDRYWEALLEGGTAEPCGWLRDRYGLSWQIVPRGLIEMTSGPDREASRRAAQAMLKMTKIDLGELQAAYEGRAAA